MPTAFRARALAALLLVAGASEAAAEWHFTPLIGYTFKGATTLLDSEDAAGRTRWHLGGAVTLLGDGPLGAEALFLYTPGFLQNPDGAPIDPSLRVVSSRTYAFMGNAVLTVPRAWSQYGLRPYVSGGAGHMHIARIDQLRTLPFRLNLVGMNVGGGAVGFLNDRVGLRFDLRYFRKIHGPDEDALEFPVVPTFEPIRLRYFTATLGVVVRY